MKKLTLFIRVISVAPIMALVMLLILYFRTPLLFGDVVNFVLSVIFLAVFPLLAYPLQPLIKKYKDKGREGQRTLAMIFAVAGYIFGCIFGILLRAPKAICIIHLSYLLSGALIVAFNKLCHYKASGHACGVTGPFLLLVYFGQVSGYSGILVLALVWLSSLYMKRHTALQLAVGSVIPFAALGIVHLALFMF